MPHHDSQLTSSQQTSNIHDHQHATPQDASCVPPCQHDLCSMYKDNPPSPTCWLVQHFIDNPTFSSPFFSSLQANANLETSLRQSRAACIETKTRLLDEANNTFKTDAVVCYHGESSIARFGDYLTDKSPEVYRYLGYYKCGGVG